MCADKEVAEHIVFRAFGLEVHQLVALSEGALPYNTSDGPGSAEEARLLDCFRRLSASNRALYLQLGLALIASTGPAAG